MQIDRRQLFVVGGAAVAAGALSESSAWANGRDDNNGPGHGDHGNGHDGHDDGHGGDEGHGEPKGIWLPGDTHVHDDHSSDGSAPRQLSNQRDAGNLPVSDQIAYGESVGLAFMPLTDHRTFDQHWDPLWKSDKLLLLTGEEANGSPHAIVLGATDDIVDGANPAGSASFRHLQQSIWAAHAEDAYWQVAHADDGEFTKGVGPNDNASAIGVDGVELFNVSSDPDTEIDYAENRWNKGFRFGATGASDSHFKELRPVSAPGAPTTWVFAAERSVRAILDALRAGRTTISYNQDGPFVTLEADVDGDGRYEAIGGDEIIVQHGVSKKATLRVRLKGAKGMRVIVYASPGRSAGALATIVPTKDDETHVLPLKPTGDHSWFRAEVRAPGALAGRDSDPALPDQLRGATSPVFVSMRQAPSPAPELPIPPATTTDDHASLVFGGQGSFAGFADLAVSGRDTHVVAQVHRDSRTTVVYRRVGGPEVTLSGDSGTAKAPRIVASGDDVWVVWQDERGHEQPHRPAIYLRHSRNGGKSFDSAVRLSTGTGRAEQPAIALVDNRHPVVAWADNTNGAFDVYAMVVGTDRTPVNLSAAGKTIVVGTAADARSPIYPASLFPSVAVTRSGRVIVTWQDNRFDPDAGWTGHTPPEGQPASGGTTPDNWEILASVRSNGKWGASVRVNPHDDAADRHPSVTVDGAGSFVVAWETKALSASGANLSLKASRSTDGTTWSPAEPIAVEPAAMSQRPKLDTDSDGVVRAVWYDSRSDDWRWMVYTSRRTGSGWSAAVQLTTRGNATWPALDKGSVVFTTDRRAERVQRDHTQEIFLTHAK
ncbi:CehA/McbA family metallohydrolase [Actinoplanes sp. TBRC 11911]|uniref:CehA/McbA family metallohydrolase n=1 Tax=Actinoplanes sp. TBRC 11911 TaxID=2729386 RepID=UPI001B7D4C5C|nr:CehA/McbA family metallohydrolase [Actinoplanes sp. TBRC 11911]